MRRSLEIVKQPDGRFVAFVRSGFFGKKKKIEWEDLEAYLRRYIGDPYGIPKDLESCYADRETEEKGEP